MKIVFIGAGNLAFGLSKKINNLEGFEIIQVISRSENSAKELSDILNCRYSINIDDVLDADLYFIAVNDDAIKKVAGHIMLKNKFVVHTSGSVDISVLSENTKKFGVFYLLQSFKKYSDIDFDEIPVIVEASDDECLKKLKTLAGKISKSVYNYNSNQRFTIHLSAVFANNFTNHLIYIAQKILTDNHISPEIIIPLVVKTAEKISSDKAEECQTGPAKRNDLETINRHIEYLKSKYDLYPELYKFISNSIIDTYKKV